MEHKSEVKAPATTEPTSEVKIEATKETKKEETPKTTEEVKLEKKEEVPKTTEEVKALPPKEPSKEDKEKEEEARQITEAISSLPLNVKPYFIALKTLSDQNEELDKQYDKEMEELEKKYQLLRRPLNIRRREIISGKKEPTDEELKSKDKFNGTPKDQPKYGFKIEEYTDQKGIPEFWYKILSNHPQVKDKIKPTDVPLLKHLIDISNEMLEERDFKLTFVFSENEYFENSQIEMTFSNDEETKSIKCDPIKWKPGKDLTKKTIKKKQKHKKSGAQRTITKEVESDSFFVFFKTIEEPDENGSGDEENDLFMQLEDNLDLGDILANDIVDDALYFYFNIVEKEGDSSDDNDDDDQSDEEEKPKHKKSKDRKDSKADDTKDKKVEKGKDCKQQ